MQWYPHNDKTDVKVKDPIYDERTKRNKIYDISSKKMTGVIVKNLQEDPRLL